MKRKHQKQRGTSIVEFAIVLPMLIILLLGIVEFGFALYDQAVITNASREGARAGIVAQNPRKTSADITAIVNNYCQTYLISFTENDPVTTVAGGGSFPNPLTVTVTYNYGFLALPNFLVDLTGPISLSASTVMLME